MSAYISAAVLFFWAGFVSSISFMEAWLKFRAAGVTKPIGLSIGSKVFSALNLMEWFFLVIAVLPVIILSGLYPSVVFLLMCGVVTILLIQTFLLLPRLVRRASAIIGGIEINKSPVHLFYIAAELMKVGLIIASGVLLLNS